jgi:hypothetical protein
MATPKKDDPMEKIQSMIAKSIEEALSGRDRKEAEAKDPWARIEGIIDRAVGKHFEEFAKGLAEGDDSGGKSKRGGDADHDEDAPKLGILGL